MASVQWTAVAAVAFLSILVPGPDVLLAMRNGAAHGVRRSCMGLLGVAISDCLLVGAVVFGIGTLLLDRADLFLALRIFGILYLAVIAIDMLRAARPSDMPLPASPAVRQRDSGSLLVRSLVVAVTNPKAWLFFSAVLPQFMSTDVPRLSQFLALGGLIAAIDAIVLFGYVLLGTYVCQRLDGRHAVWIDRISGGLLLAMAAALALHQLRAL